MDSGSGGGSPLVFTIEEKKDALPDAENTAKQSNENSTGGKQDLSGNNCEPPAESKDLVVTATPAVAAGLVATYEDSKETDDLLAKMDEVLKQDAKDACTKSQPESQNVPKPNDNLKSKESKKSSPTTDEKVVPVSGKTDNSQTLSPKIQPSTKELKDILNFQQNVKLEKETPAGNIESMSGDKTDVKTTDVSKIVLDDKMEVDADERPSNDEEKTKVEEKASGATVKAAEAAKQKEKIETEAESLEEKTSKRYNKVAENFDASLQLGRSYIKGSKAEEENFVIVPVLRNDKKKDSILENKLKTTSTISLTQSPPASGTSVLKNTPIVKPSEIPSENVSKISSAIEQSRDDAPTLLKDQMDDSPGKSEIKPAATSASTSSESGTWTSTEMDQQSSDVVPKFVNVVRQFNGITDSTTDEEEISITVKQPGKKTDSDFARNVTGAATSGAAGSSADDSKMNKKYEINVWRDEDDLKFFSVERLDTRTDESSIEDPTAMSGDSIIKKSSNGDASISGENVGGCRSVTEIITFDGKTASIDLTDSHKTKVTVNGIVELCTFMIDQFTQIKKHFCPEKLAESEKSHLSSPTARGSTIQKSRKRTHNKSISIDDDDQPLLKQAKTPDSSIKTSFSDTVAPKTPTPIQPEEGGVVGHCVLAKWVDKKYYAGRITGAKVPGNKLVVLFEDGASKVLPKESIVMGHEDLLPLKDQKIHALFEEYYETGVVLSHEKVEGKILYTIQLDDSSLPNPIVKVTASDIYLDEIQAKQIQTKSNQDMDTKISESVKRAAAADITGASLASKASGGVGGGRSTRHIRQASTSPCFSGSLSATKGGKRQTRYS